MKFFNKSILMIAIAMFFFSCADDELEPVGYDQPMDITLKQLINDKNNTGDPKVGDKGLVPRYDGQWVRISNVQFKTIGEMYNGTKSKAKGSRMIVDKDGNEGTVYTAPDKSFSKMIVPEGSGTIIGVVSFYKSKTQLLLKSVEEGTSQMTNPRF